MQFDSETNGQMGKGDPFNDLLTKLPFEKTERDFSGSVLQKLRKPTKAYNPFWEGMFLLIVFVFLGVSAYLFTRVDETDIGTNGIVKTVSGQDKLIFSSIIFFAMAAAMLFIRRYQRFKKRMAEIKEIPIS
jgi:hypothetical protein